MKNFEELSFEEMVMVDGGGGKWRIIKQWGGAILEAIGAYDAISDFQEGWNSHQCSCK
jgi:lactobin A/cerein 7B family class IIb bacteriocin